jgi:hypothetical protein
VTVHSIALAYIPRDMVCAYFRAGCPPTHRCCGMECARRFLSIVSNSINHCGVGD